MRLRGLIIVSLTLMFALVASTSANVAHTTNLFGDEQQPGNRLHQEIVALYESGDQDPISTGVELSVTDDNTMLGGEAKNAVAFDVGLAKQFYNYMAESNSLIEVTKLLIEARPADVVQTVTLAVVLYPDYAQDIYDGASLTGVMLDEDLTVAMLQAGADPTSFVETVAGPVAATVVPLGAGIGAGGTGGGDTTASTN